jgi:hypothetical protein
MLRMDDPILWGILPLSYMFNPENHRWGLASHDLCFTNKYAYHRSYSAPTDKKPERSPPSSHSGKSSQPIDPRTRSSAASSNQP